MPISRIGASPMPIAQVPTVTTGQHFNKRVTLLVLAVLGAALFIYLARSLYNRITMTAEDLFAAGEAIAKNGDFENAIESFSAALKIALPESEIYVKILFHRAQAFSELGDHGKAIKDYTRILACKSKIDDACKEVVLFNRGASSFNLDAYDEAIEDFTQALAINSSNIELRAEIFELRGSAYFAKGDHETAIQDFTTVLERPLSKATIRAKFRRGICYEKAMKFDLALKDYTEVLECGLALDYKASVLYCRGKLHSSLDHLNEAFEDFSTALECNYEDKDLLAKILHARALAYERQEKIEEAIVDLTRALNHDPDNEDDLLAQILYDRARFYEDQGDHQKALDDLTAALNNDLTDQNLHAQILSLRGSVNRKLDKNDAAIEDFTAVLECEPDLNLYAQTLYDRAFVYEIKSEHQKAHDDLAAALERNQPDSDLLAKILSLRASIHRKLGKHDAAIADYTLALNCNPDSDLRVSILLKRGIAYREHSDHALAIADFTEGLKDCSSDDSRAVVLYFRAFSQHSLGHKDEALEDLKAAQECKSSAEDLNKEIEAKIAEIHSSAGWRSWFPKVPFFS